MTAIPCRSLPDPCLSFTILSMRTDSQDKRDKNYPARIPFVFKGDSIQIQIVMVRPCESHLVIFNLIYLIKPMPSFFYNPDPFLLFIVLGFARRMIIKATRQYSIVRQSKCKLRQILAGSEPRPVGSDKYLVFNLHQHPSHTAHVQ